jgi:hypothetical protein
MSEFYLGSVSIVFDLLAIIEKRLFLSGRPTGIAVGQREMDQSRYCGDRRSRTRVRSPSAAAPGEVIDTIP